MADSIESDDYLMRLARFSSPTEHKITAILTEKRLDSLVTIANPLDINPAADDQVHADIAAVILEDEQVDALIISLDPLSPVMRTLQDPEVPYFDMDGEESIKKRIIDLAASSTKPIITVVDGGRTFDPLRDSLRGAGVPVFDVCDHGVAVLALYIAGRLKSRSVREQTNEWYGVDQGFAK